VVSTENIGARIRGFREHRGMSLAELAERTGLDDQFVQAVEQENVYPSLGPLLKSPEFWESVWVLSGRSSQQ